MGKLGAYLRNKAVNHTMSVVYDQVPQLINGYVIERPVFVRKPDAFVGTHLPKHL